MISKECFTLEWINELSAKFKYNDRILIEKVIRAFSLLELLVSNRCPLTWKGVYLKLVDAFYFGVTK